MFYADVSKSEEISRWQLIDKALYDYFSAVKNFLQTATIVYQKDSCSF